jgi:hypothetical protein
MTDEIIIRPSVLTRWPDCNRRGAAHLLRREIQAAGFRLRRLRRGIGAAIGSAVHAAAEITLDEKAKSGALPPASVATDIAAQSLQRALAEGEILYDGPNGVTHNRSDASRQTVRMAAAYHRVAAPLIEPILVEQRLEAEVAPGIILAKNI